MTITPQYFQVTNNDIFKQQMLSWADRSSIFCLLDNNGYNFSAPAFECILAVGSRRTVDIHGSNAFEKLKEFYDQSPTWMFGHVGYNLTSPGHNTTGPDSDNEFPPGFFFEPEVIIQLEKEKLIIMASVGEADKIYNEICAITVQALQKSKPAVKVTAGINEEEYIQTINALKDHIRRGDCYEINFCQRFLSDHATINPIHTYVKLAETSPMPFAALYKLNENYCICASPERYLKKTGDKIISQPMKGTSERNSVDAGEDESNKNYLLQSNKERSENVMIVDLVRNDLSKVCREGSVIVEELFGVYSFPHVHQMTSTISGIIRKDLHWTQALSATFPMGSMTGAPKQRVMELIAQYEQYGRGLFSGSIGYVTPDADFDFNVVIRSIFYNRNKMQLSFYAGSGITFHSDPLEEYEECKLKTNAIIEVLSN